MTSYIYHILKKINPFYDLLSYKICRSINVQYKLVYFFLQSYTILAPLFPINHGEIYK